MDVNEVSKPTYNWGGHIVEYVFPMKNGECIANSEMTEG